MRVNSTKSSSDKVLQLSNALVSIIEDSNEQEIGRELPYSCRPTPRTAPWTKLLLLWLILGAALGPALLLVEDHDFFAAFILLTYV